jgi:heat-inducible transcriptional repressor
MGMSDNTLPETAPQAAPDVTPRARQVLADIVETYGQHGEPVGSKALVECGKYNLSGASIRNVMQDLEHWGLIMSPHTSAGRIPTEQGYRYYAQHLLEAEAPEEAVKAALRDQITPHKSMNALVQDLSSTLSHLTNCAALITVPKTDNDTLETMDFLRMAGNKVLVVMVTQSGEIENRIIEVPDFLSLDDLQRAAQELRPIVKGQNLEQARTAMIAAIAEQKGQVNAMIDQMMAAAHEWGEPVTADGAMVVAGSTNLFQYPELVRDRLQGLIKMFEEKRLLMALVEEVRQGSGVKVFVGADVPLTDPMPAHDVSVVATPYGTTDKKRVGSLGVIGPLRMDYKRTVGIVDYTRDLLNRVVNPR